MPPCLSCPNGVAKITQRTTKHVTETDDGLELRLGGQPITAPEAVGKPHQADDRRPSEHRDRGPHQMALSPGAFEENPWHRGAFNIDCRTLGSQPPSAATPH